MSMKVHRGFILMSKAWYSRAAGCQREGCVDEVMFGDYPESPASGTNGEMTMRWYELGGKPAPRLEVFEDAWKVLATFGDVIETLAEYGEDGPSPAQFCADLQRLGFQDRTPREEPVRAGERRENPTAALVRECEDVLSGVSALRSEQAGKLAAAVARVKKSGKGG